MRWEVYGAQGIAEDIEYVLTDMHAQAERNEGMGIRPNKAQLEFAWRYVYSGCFRRETWQEYIKRKGLIF